LDDADADSEAYETILKAIETYDPAGGASFATWLGMCARGSITRASRESQRQGQIPRPSKSRATPKPGPLADTDDGDQILSPSLAFKELFDAPDAEGADQRHDYTPSNARPKAEIPEESDGLVDAFLKSGGTIKKIPPALPKKDLPPLARHTSATRAAEPAPPQTAQDKELSRDIAVAGQLDGLCSWWRREWLNRVKGTEENRRDRKIADLIWVKEVPRRDWASLSSAPEVDQDGKVTWFTYVTDRAGKTTKVRGTANEYIEQFGIGPKIRCHTRAEAAEILGISERALNRRRTAIIHQIAGMTEEELLSAMPGRARWSTPIITEIPMSEYSLATEMPLRLATPATSGQDCSKTTNIV
jgi:hypothetical protein